MKNVSNNRIVILILAFWTSLSMKGMDGTLFPKEKMASSLISKTCQDHYGFVWIATDFGLSSFDGYHFQNYYHESDDSTSIPDNIVRSLLCTNDGKMFIGCASGLAVYDYHTDTFHRYRFPHGISPHVKSMVELPSGEVIIAASGYGIFVLKNGKIFNVAAFAEMSNSLHFDCLQISDSGKSLWAQTEDRRLLRFTLNGVSPKRMTVYDVDKGTVINAFNLKNGSVLFALNSGFMIYDHRRHTIENAPYIMPETESITSAYLTKSGDLYVGTLSGNFYKIRKGESESQKVTLFNGQDKLDYFVVNNILEDKDNNLWLSSPHHGVFMCSMMPKMFKSINFANFDRHICYGFSAIAPAPDNGLYCVVRYGSVIHVDKNGTASYCKGIPDYPSTIMRDSRGEYWIGTWKHLYSYDPLSGKSVMENDLNGKGTPRIAEDRMGNIYVSILGEGFALLDRKTRKMTYYNSRNQSAVKGVKFNNDWVGMMYQDKKGYMWIATSSGVWCFDPSSRHFVDLGNGGYILRGIICNSLCELPSGDIIIGTINGVYAYNREKRMVTLLSGTEKIKDLKICGLVKDTIGNVWISTMRGLWQYISTEKRIVSYVGVRGIAENEFGEWAWTTLDDGSVAFGSNSSVTVFNPLDTEHGLVKGKSIRLTRFATLEKVFDPLVSEFSIPWDDNHFTMSFSLFDFQYSDNIDFEYRLNGGPWTAFADGNNSLTFTKLKYGTYNIDVRATSGGFYSSDISAFKVIVLPPWYATPWAKIIYALLVSITVWFVLFVLRKRQRLAFDEEKMQLLINATHDIRSPLTMILGPIERLKELVKKNCDEVTRKSIDQYVDIINRNADRLLLLVNQILDTRKIDKLQMHLKCRETDMGSFVRRVCHSFEFKAEQRDIDLTVTCDEEHVMAWIDHDNFDKVLVNLLSNAFKFTLDGGHIDIHLFQNVEHIIIMVTDDGQGFGKEKVSRLFERFYQGTQSGESTVGTGIGLNLAMNIVKLHGGTISASNRTDGQHGACFTISLPAGNAHLKPEDLYVEPVKERIGKKVIYRKYRIMVVDDDTELTAYIADELRPWYYVDVFSNGIDALKSILLQEYDLVVSDVVMPGMDGTELLKKVKQNPNTNHIPVILLSTKAEAEDRLAGFKSGADAYIAKPFSTIELRVRIDSIISNVLRLRGKFSGTQQQRDKVENVEKKSYDDELMKRVMKSINAHISDDSYSIDVLSQEVGMSRAQLHRNLKHITGVATGKFIRNIRMEQAARLLLEGNVNCSDVAYRVGFCDIAHFSTVFKQYYGMSPSEYAKKHNADK